MILREFDSNGTIKSVDGDGDQGLESKSELSNGGQDTLTVYASLLRGALHGDKALAASQQMFQLVTASIPQAIFWKDRAQH